MLVVKHVSAVPMLLFLLLPLPTPFAGLQRFHQFEVVLAECLQHSLQTHSISCILTVLLAVLRSRWLAMDFKHRCLNEYTIDNSFYLLLFCNHQCIRSSNNFYRMQLYLNRQDTLCICKHSVQYSLNSSTAFN